VQRSSESIGVIAVALAKAQAEINPEKSFIGIIGPSSPQEPGRSFRYAPLSSGLDIVRKSLGRHAIAIVQSTEIDKEAGFVRLNTMLAHESGEWVSSEWPVCPITDTASPQRMGAALSYARRYALFTLVGIAGEDDLDAPDICMPAPAATPPTDHAASTTNLVPRFRPPPRTDGNDRTPSPAKAVRSTILSSEESACLRDRLVGEIAALDSHDSVTSWAHEALVAKNKLTAADAKLLETAFEQKLSELLRVERGALIDSDPSGASQGARRHPSNGGINKSVLAVATPRRYRNRNHLRFVSQQPCLVCARKPSDAHHIKFVQPRALGRKASDEFAVPLCRSHHRAVHRAGDEEAWWQQTGIDPAKVARKLWNHTRIDEGRIEHDPPPQGAASDGITDSGGPAAASEAPA